MIDLKIDLKIDLIIDSIIDLIVQSLHSSARDRDLDDWLRQSLLRNCVMPPMPPRRRKYNIDVVEEEKPNSKRLKNSIMSSDRY